MNRSIELFLKEWYQKPNRKPLVLRGARQVGKSFSVREFAKAMNIPLWEINLEKNKHLNSVFASFDINKILVEIGLAVKQSNIGAMPGLLFLDEIQATPDAIAALRYFYEEQPGLAVVAAGSLLEFVLAETKNSMPVGRIQYHRLGPVSFQEYLMASDNSALTDYYSTWQIDQPFSETAHNGLKDLLRQFLITGGMPEAGQRFLDSGRLDEVYEIHRSIFDTYSDDFGKYAGGAMLEKLKRVFEHLPRAIGDKFKPTHINRDWKAQDVRGALDLLARAGIVSKVNHCSVTGIPLGLHTDDEIYKPLFLDVGLVQTALGMPAIPLEKFISGKFINEGPIAEQFIGQHLQYLHPERSSEKLYYWLREGKSTNAEVDYVLQIEDLIIPVEVKSGKSGSMRSLHYFISQRNFPLAVRFDLNPPTVQKIETFLPGNSTQQKVAYHLLSLPLYMVDRLEILVKQVIQSL